MEQLQSVSHCGDWVVLKCTAMTVSFDHLVSRSIIGFELVITRRLRRDIVPVRLGSDEDLDRRRDSRIVVERARRNTDTASFHIRHGTATRGTKHPPMFARRLVACQCALAGEPPKVLSGGVHEYTECGSSHFSTHGAVAQVHDIRRPIQLKLNRSTQA